MVSGIDLIKEQIRIASGCEIRYRQEDISIRGSAIECRINAEDPFNDFAPVPGKISAYYQPAGPGIRVDSGVWLGSIQSPFYDPMMAKLIAWGGDRDEAIARMRRSLYEFIIAGIQSNIPFHQAILENQRFIKGDLGTQFIDQTSSLMEDMKQVAAKKLPIRFIDKEKIAAVAAAAMVYKSRQ
jgi:pyruvate carboxylase subunit A